MYSVMCLVLCIDAILVWTVLNVKKRMAGDVHKSTAVLWQEIEDLGPVALCSELQEASGRDRAGVYWDIFTSLLQVKILKYCPVYPSR